MSKYALPLILLLLLAPSHSALATSGEDPANEQIATEITDIYEDIEDNMDDLYDLKDDGYEEISSQQKSLVSTIQTTKEATTDAVMAALKQHLITRNVHKNTQLYSPLAQSSFACCETDRAKGALSGSRSIPGAKQEIYENIQEYNEAPTSTNESYKRTVVLVEEIGTKAGGILIPKSNTYSEDELIDATLAAFALTNPNADMISPEKYLDRSTGQKYEALRRMELAKLTVSQMILSEYITRKTALYPLSSWMGQMSKALGMSGSHEDVQGGKISADALLNMEVKSRYENASYIVDLHRKTEAGVLREALQTNAINMEMYRLANTGQELNTLLMAVRYSTEVQNSTNHILDEHYRNMIKTMD